MASPNESEITYGKHRPLHAITCLTGVGNRMTRGGDWKVREGKTFIPCPKQIGGAWMRRSNPNYPAAIIGNQRRAGMGDMVTDA